MSVRALVLTGFGLNCDFETAHVLSLAGAESKRVHISDLTGAPGQSPVERLDNYNIVVFDGGFAWGDDHGAGVILSTRLKNHLGDQMRAFLEHGGLVLGICNGFQALVNFGLLPMLDGSWKRKVALAANDCGNFQDRWVELMVNTNSPCVFTKGLERIEVPIRHGEGKLIADDDTLAEIEDRGLVAVRYGNGNGNGKVAGGKWPHNPNGSMNDIAGICDPTGRVFGLMPHPEAFYRLSQHPTWTAIRERARRKGKELGPQDEGPGLMIFRNAVAAAKEAL